MAELKHVVVDAISLVKKGANGEPIQIYKSAEPLEGPTGPKGDPGEPGVSEVTNGGDPWEPGLSGEAAPADENEAGGDRVEATKNDTTGEQPSVPSLDAPTKGILKSLFGPIIEAVIGKSVEEIEKSQDIDNSIDYNSFLSRISNPETRFDQAVDALRWSCWDIFWDRNVKNGKELILKNIDDFRSYVENILNTDRSTAEVIFQKGEPEMTKEEMAQALTEALEPVTKSITDLTAKLDAVEKSEEPAAEASTETPAEGSSEPVAKSDEAEQTQPDMAEIVKSALKDALEPINKSLEGLSERVQTIETTKGISKSAGEPKGSAQVAKGETDEWPDIHIPMLG